MPNLQVGRDFLRINAPDPQSVEDVSNEFLGSHTDTPAWLDQRAKIAFEVCLSAAQHDGAFFLCLMDERVDYFVHQAPKEAQSVSTFWGYNEDGEGFNVYGQVLDKLNQEFARYIQRVALPSERY